MRGERRRYLNRREFVAVVGAGLGGGAGGEGGNKEAEAPAPAPTAAPATAQATDNVKIRFYGASLFNVLPRTPGQVSRSVEVLMPYAHLASGESPYHADTTTAVPHSPFLALYRDHKDGYYEFEYPLQGKAFTIEGAANLNAPTFGTLPDMKRILRGTATLRKNLATPNDLSAKITIIGGTWSTITRSDIGSWRVARSFNSSAPALDPVVVGLEWDSGMKEVPVSGAGTGFPTKLPDQAHPVSAIIVGHLPTSMPPKSWYVKGDPPARGDADVDFKWLYRLFDPKPNPSNDPWLDELDIDVLLPAPRCVAGRTRNTPVKTTVDSPTCFGGCWGC